MASTFDAMMDEAAAGDFYSSDDPETIAQAAIDSNVSGAIKNAMADLLAKHMRSVEKGTSGYWLDDELWYKEYVALARGLRQHGVDSGATVYHRALVRLERQDEESYELTRKAAGAVGASLLADEGIGPYAGDADG